MHYVYYASLYTVWTLMPVGIPDRKWWAEMAAFLEECLLIIQLGGDDRFKIKKVNPVVDEGYETGDGSDCGGGFRGCRDGEGGHVDADADADADDEEEEEVRENNMEGQDQGHTPEIVSWDRRDAGGKVESSEERLRLDSHGHGHRDSQYRAWAVKILLKYGTTFHWDDENGEPTFDDVRYQLWQKICHDLREIDLKLGGRVYTKPALGFR
ncbi:hypothetical protein BDV27DRAFT_166316 [Aspergillus caelatus]|uniref:Uncharacterized protein n=1 Tax=Aspergillus caelatus TaxID=61420 RepID=A0A5N6ZZH6_9EURO|nr:uncharacterized protein BDV27DRAFT_166316 [Aspergillus caelatus]KAE8362339.1 hypothetical protein BDV27DRAFT_166316 [Aspergillus caelatus]